MRTNIILTFLFLYSTLTLFSQKINIQFPREANKQFVFILNQGIKQDTVARGSLNFAGSGTITIPSKYAGYIGIGHLKIDKGSSTNLVVNSENFSVIQQENATLKFVNSKENSYLYNNNKDVSTQKDTSLYADKFLQMYSFIQTLNKASSGQLPLQQKSEIRYYALHQLNIDALYTSGLWYYGIDGILKLSTAQDEIGRNMIEVLKRIKSQIIFESLVENLITITEQYGWDDAFNIIIPYVEKSGRIKTPQGNIFIAFALAKVNKGSIAPKLIGLKASQVDYNKTLLFFYDPGCHNCNDEKKLLTSKIGELNSKKIRIVSISSDSDKKIFFEDAGKLPWDDKLCDFKGFAGANFINYGIMGTPTFFLLDKNWKVIGRYAQVRQIPF